MFINVLYKQAVAECSPGFGKFNAAEHCVLRFLADRINAHDHDPICWYSQSKIGERFGWSRDYAGRVIRSLEAQGYLTIEHRSGTSNLYRLLDRSGRVKALIAKHSEDDKNLSLWSDDVPPVAYGSSTTVM